MPESTTLTVQFAVWLANRHPEIITQYEAESEKLDTLAALERTIAEATEEARRLRAELGETSPFLTEAADPPKEEEKPAPKKRAPRKPKPVAEPEPDVTGTDEEIGNEPGGPMLNPVPDAEVIEDETDFEEFEIPADDADDEF